MKKKVLLMGASGSGKTSMRSLIFSNNPASLTARLGATIDVEQNHVRFLGDLILNLWDCGGQEAFMDSYLTTQRDTIFKHVGVLIYVFEVNENTHGNKDMSYFQDCLRGLTQFSPEARVFLLVHKMDLVKVDREKVFERRKRELQKECGDVSVTVFGTSIYDETLYKAWSNIVHTLIPNAAVLSKHLAMFAHACSAAEVILFERTTFLVIATSNPPSPTSRPASPTTQTQFSSSIQTNYPTESEDSTLNPTRYEKTSELIKAFKHACSRVREEFTALEMELADYTAVLDEMTRNTYVLVVVHDPTIEMAAIKMNIRMARQKFEELQGDN